MATDKDFLDAGAQIVAGAVIFDGKTVGHYNHGNFILTDEGMRLSEKMAAEDVEVKRTVTRKPAKKAGTDAADGEADTKE